MKYFSTISKGRTPWIVLWVASLLLVSGCGFALRGSGYEGLAGQTVFLLSKNPYGYLERSLKKNLASYALIVNNHTLKASDDGKGIEVISVSSKESTLSVDLNGRPVEYETTINVDLNFTINNLHQQKHFSVRRDFRYDNKNSLAVSRELETLNIAMHQELAQRIVGEFMRQLTLQQASHSSID